MLCGVATIAFLVLTAVGIERQVSWYLAVDQYGYLAFAQDLLAGRILHHWPPLDALGPYIPEHVDVLTQTYVRDGGRLYCRYAPGFSLMLAGWMRVLGNVINSPADTVVTASDFVFRPVSVDELYAVPTITAVFAARRPRPAATRVANGARRTFVDDSFTRPPPAMPSSWPARVWQVVAAR